MELFADIGNIFLKILLSIVLSSVVGLDRSVKNRGAGLRTYVIVCMASTLVMMLGMYLSSISDSDPARLGAQVISGIGFLGAGTIIQWRSMVKGLTTAAGLWGVACVGLAVGASYYAGAVITTLAIFVILRFATRLEQEYIRKNKSINAFLEIYSPADNLNMFCRIAEARGLIPQSTNIIGSDTVEGKRVLFAIGIFRLSKHISGIYHIIFDELSHLSFVRNVKIVDDSFTAYDTDSTIERDI